jgi:hypothetical protein
VRNKIYDPNNRNVHSTINPVELSFIKVTDTEYEVFQINSSYGISGTFVKGYIVENNGGFNAYWSNDCIAYRKKFETVYDALEALEMGHSKPYNSQVPCDDNLKYCALWPRLCKESDLISLNSQ